MVSLPAWFLEPPVLGASSPDDTVVEATTTAEYDKYTSDGYPGPYSSKAAAQSAANSINANQNENEKLDDPNGVASNAIPGLSQIGDFFGALTQGNTWIRVGKIAAGAILIIAGLMTLMPKQTELGVLTDVATKLPGV
jgi:hypothetical protein